MNVVNLSPLFENWTTNQAKSVSEITDSDLTVNSHSHWLEFLLKMESDLIKMSCDKLAPYASLDLLYCMHGDRCPLPLRVHFLSFSMNNRPFLTTACLPG